MEILTSIRGDKAGFGSDDSLIIPGGLVSGKHGKQVRHAAPNRVSYFEDFLGDVIPDQINALEGTDSATSACAILAGGIGGVMRLTTGDAGTGFAADAESVVMALQWQASNGGLACEARLKMSAVTTCTAFFGFTDDATTLEQSILFATGTTFTTNASDACGWLFDTVSTADTWYLTGVAADVDATMQNSGFAPVADTYETLRIEINSTGAATFFRNGKQVGTKMSGAVTATTDLTPVIYVSKLSVAASMTMDIDYWHVTMNRGADGAAV